MRARKNPIRLATGLIGFSSDDVVMVSFVRRQIAILLSCYEIILTDPVTMSPLLPYLRILRKEVIQPQVPLRLPCYDLVPIVELTFGTCLSCELA